MPAVALWLDIARREWNNQLLAACHLSRAHMPALAEGSIAAGTLKPAWAKRWGIKGDVVIAGAGDNAAAACGLGVVSLWRWLYLSWNLRRGFAVTRQICPCT